ncbi:sigma-E processing peptidase SpoIIGA [Marinicrinis sediminis]|uniref:Sigma-E processing peptidase SpoIIGA n=1 Tax=Marinicrinis sediminis TaxID=1652465 RepID=A0ABW5RC69_9BACL
MVIYADIVFLTNVLIDTITLSMTAWMQKLKIKPVRIGLASCLGALYVVMMFVPALSALYTLAVKGLFSVCMLWMAFGFHSLQSFLRNFMAFYMVNFVAAGGIFGLYYMSQSHKELLNGIWFTSSGGGTESIHMSLITVMVLLVVLLVLYRRLLQATDKKQKLTHLVSDVTIHIGPHAFTCKGLVDTGNRLYDPLTSTPVMIVEWSVIEEICTDAIRRGIQEGQQALFDALEDEEFAYREKLRFVPYRGVQKGTDFLLAIKPERVCIQQGAHWIEQRKVLLGLKGEALSGEGVFQAIIHPDLMDGAQQEQKSIS